MKMKKFSDIKSNESGAVYLEAAITLPILFLIFSGIVQYGMYISTKITLQNATSVAVRTAILPHDNTTDQETAVRSVINATIPGLDVNLLSSIAIDPAFLVNGQAATKVDLSYDLPLIFSRIIPGNAGSVQINTSAVMR